jgi:hypothetical protein
MYRIYCTDTIQKGNKYKMRNLINIIVEQLDAIDPGDSDPTRGPMPTTPAQPAQKTVAPATAPAEPNYATQFDYKSVIPVLFDSLVATGAFGTGKISQEEFSKLQKTAVKYKKDAGRLPLIRTSGITDQQLLKATARLGLKEIPLTDLQRASSGQFNIHSFTQGSKTNNIVLTIVIAGRNKAQSAAGASSDLVLARKGLTPAKLELVGTYTNRQDLITATKAAVTKKISNKNLAAALHGLVDLAADRGQGQLDPKLLKYITPVLATVSQDFGEILAPIAVATDSEDIAFPVGNAELIDVTVGGKARYSVKALGGSGTSMNSLGSLLNDYELTMTDEGKKKLFQDGIKIYQSTKKEGSVEDRVVLAANRNQIPEYVSYANVLGGEFQSFKELKSLLTPIVKNLSYADFLKMILPAAGAGHWGKPIGMPVDSKYYLGLTDVKPEPGQAGKYSYEHDPVDGAANIITYSLGKATEFMIVRGPNQQQYSEIMNDMMRQMNCQLAHVAIDSLGKLVISASSFADLDFIFDYHAASNSAGRNRPGFIIVPPNKKKKVKEARERQIHVSAPRERR